MGRQIPVNALKEDVHAMIWKIREKYPELVRFEYRRGYLDVFDDDARIPEYYFLTKRLTDKEPIAHEQKSRLVRLGVQLLFHDFWVRPDGSTGFYWTTDRLYLNTWDPLPEQIQLYQSMANYIRRVSWRFKYCGVVHYVMPKAAELIQQLREGTADPRYDPVPEELLTVELLPPARRKKTDINSHESR